MKNKVKKLLPHLVVAGLIASLFVDKKTVRKIDEMKKISFKLVDKIVKDLSSVQKLTKREYDRVIEGTIKDLKKGKKLSVSSWAVIETELKAKWSEIGKEISKARRVAKK